MRERVKISLIAAIAKKDKGIGFMGQVPWHVPGELKRFKEITTPHPIIMGRKTYESIGRILPGRLNIVITRNPEKIKKLDGMVVVNSLDMAIEKAEEADQEEIFIIGGGEIFKEGIKLADKLYLSIVEGNFTSDTYFPDYSDFKKVIKEEEIESGEYRYKFLELER